MCEVSRGQVVRETPSLIIAEDLAFRSTPRRSTCSSVDDYSCHGETSAGTFQPWDRAVWGTLME
jgi:hypothetical protein